MMQHCPGLPLVGYAAGKEILILGNAFLLIRQALAQDQELIGNTLSRIAESEILSGRCGIFLNCLGREELLEFRLALIIGAKSFVGFCFCQVKIVHL